MKEEEYMDKDMTKGRPLGLIMRFALPLIIGNMVQQLYNMADTVIVGRFVGADALAAVGSTGTIMFLVLGFANGLTTGFTVLTGQAFGAGEIKRVKHSVANAVILSAIIAAVISVLSVLSMGGVLHLMNTPENIYHDALIYISIICAGTACSVYYNLFSAMLRSVGNSMIPLIILAFSAVLNVILDLTLIIGVHMGVAGAALATVTAQGISALLSLAYIYKKSESLKPDRDDWHLTRSDTNFQIRVGLPMAIQYAITASGTMIMQAAINMFGSAAVASISAANKAVSLFTQIFPAMGQTMAAYTAQNYGKGDIDRVKKGTRQAVIATTLMGAAASVIVVLTIKPLMGVFFSGEVDMDAMLTLAKPYVYACAVCFTPLGMIFIYRNVMQACGQALLPVMGGVAELLCRVGCAAAAIVMHNYYAAAFCDPAAWLGAGPYFLIAYMVSMKKTARNLGHQQKTV